MNLICTEQKGIGCKLLLVITSSNNRIIEYTALRSVFFTVRRVFLFIVWGCMGYRVQYIIFIIYYMGGRELTMRASHCKID